MHTHARTLASGAVQPRIQLMFCLLRVNVIANRRAGVGHFACVVGSAFRVLGVRVDGVGRSKTEKRKETDQTTDKTIHAPAHKNTKRDAVQHLITELAVADRRRKREKQENQTRVVAVVALAMTSHAVVLTGEVLCCGPPQQQRRVIAFFFSFATGKCSPPACSVSERLFFVLSHS